MIVHVIALITRFFFWFCLFLLIPGMLLRIPVGGAGILLTDIFVPLYAVFWLGQKIFLERKIKKSSFVLPAFLFSTFALVTFIFGSYGLALTEKMVSFAYLVRFISIVIFGWSATELFKDKSISFWKGILSLSGVVVLLGFLQFFIFPDISIISEEGKWDPHTGRLLGSWMDPNFMAGFMSFLLPVSLGLSYKLRKESFVGKKRLSIVLWICIALFGLALFLTFSRSGYLAAAFGVGLFLLIRDPKFLLIGIIVLSLGVASNDRAQERITGLVRSISSVILQDTDALDPTANLRVESWRKSLTLFEKHPFIGIGYNTYRYRAAEEGIVDPSFFSAGGSDSTLLNILITTGIFGFILFLWFYGGMIVRYFLKYFQSFNPLHLGFSCSLMAMIVHSMFTNSILFPLIFLVIMSVAGILEED